MTAENSWRFMMIKELCSIEELGWAPPTITAQQKGVRVVRGRPSFYTKPEISRAKAELLMHIKRYAPEQPTLQPLIMRVKWTFYKKTAKKGNDGICCKDTRPDLDNLQKLLQDSMNGLFYKDDSQIFKLTAIKCESNELEKCGIVIELDEYYGD